MSHPVKIILGAATIGSPDDPMVGPSTPSKAQHFLNIFRNHGYKDVDTARAYSPQAARSCEPLLGQTDIVTWATIDTKVGPLAGYDLSAASLTKALDDSLSALQVKSVNIYYLHAPDRKTPLSETHKAIDDAYKAGKFKHFGLSNYEAHEVETLMLQSDQHGWVKPTYYQGQYNTVLRSAETAILPTLRKHNIVFYAWSPAAGGFFGKQFRLGMEGYLGDMTRGLYGSDAMAKTLERLKEVSEKDGITPHAISLRWILFHSLLNGDLGDGIVIGARTDEQLEDTLKACKEGPLPDEVLALVEECWTELEPSAPYFSPFKDLK